VPLQKFPGGILGGSFKEPGGSWFLPRNLEVPSKEPGGSWFLFPQELYMRSNPNICSYRRTGKMARKQEKE
jgi:hypothetical protein